MRGSRTTTEKKAEVINSKLTDNNKTLREIEDDTGVNRETARKIIEKDLPKVVQSSDKLVKLVDINTLIINAGKKRLLKDVENEVTKTWNDRTAMNKIIEDSFKQNQLLTGGSTDNQNNVGESEEELRAKLSELQEKNKHLK